MLCDRCQKHEATIEIREVVGSTKKTVHLCTECAMADGMLQANGITVDLTSILCNLTSKVLGGNDTGAQEPEPDHPQITCPDCGTTDLDVRRTGRLGCPSCYDAFAGFVDAALVEMHRGTTHVVGSTPSPAGRPGSELEMAALREELELAVASEAYERAAELRDRIDACARLREGT